MKRIIPIAVILAAVSALVCAVFFWKGRVKQV